MRVKKKLRLEIPDRRNIIVCFENNEEEFQMEEALFQAAADGEHEKVEQLLVSGVSVDGKEFNKLLSSAERKRVAHSEIIAARSRKTCIVRVDIPFGVPKYNVTPLQIAAANGHDKCIQILTNYGANADAVDSQHIAALHLAAEMGHHLCIKVLLGAGADVSLPSNRPQCRGMTALHFATLRNHAECVKELLQNGADYNSADEHGRTSLHIGIKAAGDECVLALLASASLRGIVLLSTSYLCSDTPLHFAVKRGKPVWVKKLLSLGFDVNCTNYAGYSPLHLVLTECCADKKLEILQLLLEEGCDTTVKLPVGQRLTPLKYVLAAESRLRLGEEIRESCSSQNQEDAELYLNMAKLLVGYYGDANASYEDGFTLLERELLSCNTNFEFLKHLIGGLHRVPHLTSLNVWSDNKVIRPSVSAQFDFEHDGEGTALNSGSVSSDDVRISLFSDVTGLCFELNESAVKFLELKLEPFQLLPNDFEYPANNFVIKGVQGVLERRIEQLNRRSIEKAASKVKDNFNILVDFYRNSPFSRSESGDRVISSLYSDLAPFLDQPLENIEDPFEHTNLLQYRKHAIRAFKTVKDFSKRNTNFKFFADVLKVKMRDLHKALERYLNYERESGLLSLCALRNRLWYELMACNPQTLQHHCRIAIRKCMGISKLRFVKDLPIPKRLQSYVLFGCEKIE